MEFEFNNQFTPQSLIDIDNIGAFALEAVNEDGIYYYYIVQTIIGQSIIASCGPIIPDIDILPSGFCVTIYKMPYNEIRLTKAINLFLNDKYKKITDARIIDIEEAIDQFRDVKSYLKNLTVESF